MKRLFCLAAFLFFIAAANSQKAYFVYIQSELDQPFFVGLRDQTFASNSAGYLILPKLSDSTYLLKVGFPNNKWRSQSFQVIMNGKDRGFLLKNFAEKGWGLFDLQTMAVIMATEEPKDKSVVTTPKEVSAFTEVLSRAANDPTLKERTVTIKPKEEPVAVQTAVVKEAIPEVKQPSIVADPKTVAPLATKTLEGKDSVAVAKKEPINTDTLAAAVTTAGVEKKDSVSAVAAKQEIIKEPVPKVPENAPISNTQSSKPVITPEGIATSLPEEKKNELKASPGYEKSVVTRKSESSTTEGFGAVYIDAYADGRQDTIRIVIPNPKVAFTKQAEPVKEEKLPQDNATNAGAIPSPPPPPEGTVGKPVVKNNFEPCKSIATEADFLQLRKRMAAQNGDENMIKESRKGFKSKCYTTAQIRNLGNLFLNEAGKFQFFEGAYPFVADREEYGALQNEFKDQYFVYRFKNLIK